MLRHSDTGSQHIYATYIQHSGQDYKTNQVHILLLWFASQ